MEIKKISLNGVDFLAYESNQQIIKSLKKRDNVILFAINARKLMTTPEYIKKEINENIGYVDGKGAIWAARRMGYKGPIKRIPGVELWLDIVDAFPDKRYYFIGSKEEVIKATIEKLNLSYRKINIVGYRNGYFDTKELPLIIEDIKDKKADMIFVAMGSPKQEDIMIEMIKHHEAIYMGLGGSFDVYTGLVKRAPKLYQNIGLEGFYRIFSNPGRLFNRKLFYGDYIVKIIWKQF